MNQVRIFESIDRTALEAQINEFLGTLSADTWSDVRLIFTTTLAEGWISYCAVVSWIAW